MLGLFPLTYEFDIEYDDTLPKVFPPYLPPKCPESKDYTLVMDLDETLIHYEEVLNIIFIKFFRQRIVPRIIMEVKICFTWFDLG
jgi:hypothetical protein